MCLLHWRQHHRLLLRRLHLTPLQELLKYLWTFLDQELSEELLQVLCLLIRWRLMQAHLR